MVNFWLSGLDILSALIGFVDFELRHWVVQVNTVGNPNICYL